MPNQRDLKCYFGCTKKGILHKFPKPDFPNLERFEAWKMVLDAETQKRSSQYIYAMLRLCDKHFEQCYRLPNGRLTCNAVPTLNIDDHGIGDNPLLEDEAILDVLQASTSLYDVPMELPGLAEMVQQPLLNSYITEQLENIWQANFTPCTSACGESSVSEGTTGKGFSDMVQQPLLDSAIDKQLIEANFTSHAALDISSASLAVSSSFQVLPPRSGIAHTEYKPKNTYQRQYQKRINNLELKLKKLSGKYKLQYNKIKYAHKLSANKQNEDVGEDEIRLLNKLTEAHVIESKIPKIKVKYAAYVFSSNEIPIKT